MNYTINEADNSGIGYQETAPGYYISVAGIPNYGHDFHPYVGSLPNYGEVIGNEKISTPFGTKCVKMLYENNEDEIVLADVGLDSYLTYRWTVSSVSGAYHYTYELNSTNNTLIANADTVMQNANIQVVNAPSTTAGMPGVFDGGGYTSGSIRVGQGQQFHYILKGYNMTMYVFNLTDFKDMETTGQFQCINSLSRLPGDPGETNITVEPGIYWFIAFCKMSNQTIDYDGEQVSGYFIPYFG